MKAPAGWRVVGEMIDSMALEGLSEDIVQYQSLDGYVVLDVGWYPDMNPDGQFRCTASQAGDFGELLYELETRDLNKVNKWLVKMFDRFRYTSTPPKNPDTVSELEIRVKRIEDVLAVIARDPWIDWRIRRALGEAFDWVIDDQNRTTRPPEKK